MTKLFLSYGLVNSLWSSYQSVNFSSLLMDSISVKFESHTFSSRMLRIYSDFVLL
jgi:hypothetical protein